MKYKDQNMKLYLPKDPKKISNYSSKNQLHIFLLFTLHLSLFIIIQIKKLLQNIFCFFVYKPLLLFFSACLVVINSAAVAEWTVMG
jgi:hypothetical protein